jgi:hypothetical protein
MDLSALGSAFGEVIQKVPQWISSAPSHWKRIGVATAALFASFAVAGAMFHRRIKHQAILREGFFAGEQVFRKADKQIGEIRSFDQHTSSYLVSFNGSARSVKMKPDEIEFCNN